MAEGVEFVYIESHEVVSDLYLRPSLSLSLVYLPRCSLLGLSCTRLVLSQYLLIFLLLGEHTLPLSPHSVHSKSNTSLRKA